ncbi:hypothetical protein Tco_0039065 [Tanacetum coccineum]
MVLGDRSSRESKNARGQVGGVEKISLTGSKFMVRGEECLEGCGGEVNGGGDDFRCDEVLENQLLSASLLICLGKRDCVERIPSADENLRELSGDEAWEAIENFAQGQKGWDNPPNIISEQEVANLKAQAKRLFGNEDVWVEMHRGIAWDKVENSDPQSTPQVLPSFDEYTPPVTCPEEVEETLGTPVEVEPLDET